MKHLWIVIALTACGPSVASTVSTSKLTPADAFTCVLREVSRRDYLPTTTEKDAGLIRAEKPVTGFAAALSGVKYFDEITAVILPEGGASSVKVSVARSKQERSEARSTAGMSVPGKLKEDGAAIQAACQQ